MKILFITLVTLTAMTVSANEFDQRQTIKLTEQQQALVLKEMRSLLVGTQAILAALSINDMDAVARHATPLGLKMRQAPENNEQIKLPATFMNLGKSVHSNFDSIADDATTIKEPQHTMKQLSETLLHCNGCHENYRIEVIPIAPYVKIKQ